MVWTGLLIGLLAFQALRLMAVPAAPAGPPAAQPGFEAPDPYREARRSRELLAGQEGAPRAASAATWSETTAATAIPDVRISSRAVRVIDGDTFDADGMRIRVADIDTPEMLGRCRYETELAARATQRLRTLLAAGPFELHPLANGRDEDLYGRKLRIVTRDGRSLGDVLVGEGLARTWSGRREPWCA